MDKAIDNLKELKIKLVYIPFLLIIFFTFINGFFNSICVELGLGVEYTTFLFNPNDFMADLLKGALSFPGPDIAGVSRWNELYQKYYYDNPYKFEIDLSAMEKTNLHGTPFMTSFYLLVRYLLSFMSLTKIFIIFQTLWIFPLLALAYKNSRNATIRFYLCISVILSYPFLFALTRGHVPSGITGVCVIASILLAYRKKSPLIIIILLAIAINIRPNLIVFCALPFLSWNYRQAFAIGVAAGICSILIFFIFLHISNHFYPSYTLNNFIKALSIYHYHYILRDDGLAYGSSLLGAIKLFGKFFSVDMPVAIIEKVIYFLSLICYGLWMIIVSIKKLNKLDAIFIFLSLSALSTGALGDYHLLAFLGILMIYAKFLAYNSDEIELSCFSIIICTCLLLVPKNYFFYEGASLQVIANPLIMILGVCLALRSSLKVSNASNWQQLC